MRLEIESKKIFNFQFEYLSINYFIKFSKLYQLYLIDCLRPIIKINFGHKLYLLIYHCCVSTYFVSNNSQTLQKYLKEKTCNSQISKRKKSSRDKK